MRAAWFVLATLVTTLVTDVFLLLTWPFGRRAQRPVNTFWGVSMLAGVFSRVKVEGKPGKGPYMIVANHASMLDIAAGFAAVRIPFHYLSRPFFFKLPVVGWGMRLGGHISIDPTNAREASRKLRDVGPYFEKGISLFMFPEGTRSPDGTIGDYKRGPFLTAIQNGVPILPVRFVDLHKAMPRGSLAFRPTRARAIIGAPIETKDLKPPDAKRLARQVEDWTRAACP